MMAAQRRAHPRRLPAPGNRVAGVVEFLDPRAGVAAPVEPYGLAADWSAGPPTIGLLANGFPDSVAFLDQVG